MDEAEQTIDVGDHVFVGNGHVHWVVDSINRQAEFAHLRSGMTGRWWRRVPLGMLRLHSKARQ